MNPQRVELFYNEVLSGNGRATRQLIETDDGVLRRIRPYPSLDSGPILRVSRYVLYASPYKALIIALYQLVFTSGECAVKNSSNSFSSSRSVVLHSPYSLWLPNLGGYNSYRL